MCLMLQAGAVSAVGACWWCQWCWFTAGFSESLCTPRPTILGLVPVLADSAIALVFGTHSDLKRQAHLPHQPCPAVGIRPTYQPPTPAPTAQHTLMRIIIMAISAPSSLVARRSTQRPSPVPDMPPTRQTPTPRVRLLHSLRAPVAVLLYFCLFDFTPVTCALPFKHSPVYSWHLPSHSTLSPTFLTSTFLFLKLPACNRCTLQTAARGCTAANHAVIHSHPFILIPGHTVALNPFSSFPFSSHVFWPGMESDGQPRA